MDIFDFDDSEFSGTKEKKGPPILKDVVLQVLHDKSVATTSLVESADDNTTVAEGRTERDEDVLSGSNARLKWNVDHFYRTRDYAACLEGCRKLRINHMLGKEVLDIQARCLMHLGQLDEAEKLANEYCNLPGMKNPEGFALLAAILSKQGRTAEALRAYQKSVNSTPVLMFHWERLADLYERLNCPASAVTCLFAGYHAAVRQTAMFAEQIARGKASIRERAVVLLGKLGLEVTNDLSASNVFPVSLSVIYELASNENISDVEDRQWFKRVLSPTLLSRAAQEEAEPDSDDEGDVSRM